MRKSLSRASLLAPALVSFLTSTVVAQDRLIAIDSNRSLYEIDRSTGAKTLITTVTLFGLLNTAGYFDDLLRFLDRSFEDGFIKPAYRGLYHVASNPADLLDRLAAHKPPAVEKWLPKDKV